MALATPIFIRLLDILNNAIKISAPKSWLNTKLSINPHSCHTNVNGLATPLQLALQLPILSPTNIWYLFMDLKSMEDAHQQLREFRETVSASAMAQVF